MANTSDVLNRLLASLTIADPTWDTSIGSATYKILESIANEISTASDNSTLQTYSYDVMSKSGIQLDAFVNLFGIARQLGKRSVGTVTFSLTSAATQIIYIPYGTQIYVQGTSNGVSNIYFNTTSAAIINVGETSVQVPVISVLPGTFNNVNAGSINQISTSIVGAPSVTNEQPLIGGSDTETDTQLQSRFQATAFSNISGTVDKFVAMALQNPNVTQVNVVGSQETYLEQDSVITVVSGTDNYTIGLQAQGTLAVSSGQIAADGLISGVFPLNTTVTSGFITQSPSGIFNNGSVIYDGSNYNLSVATSNSGTLTTNYLQFGTTVFSGSSTASDVITVVEQLLASGNYSVGASVSGTTTDGPGGLQIGFNNPTIYNVVISGTGNVTCKNIIYSQIPDSKYTYPQGGEKIGELLNSASQTLLSPYVDYIYPSGTSVPLTVTLYPNALNAPYTYTGNLLQMQSEYIPLCSRTVDPSVNSNYVDIFINTLNSSLVQEQVVFTPTNTFGSSQLPISNFNLANGLSADSSITGDYYVGVSQNPLINFPSQLVSGNSPSIVTFGSTDYPLCLSSVNSSPPTLTVSGSQDTTILYTTDTIANLQLGLAVSGTVGGISTQSYIIQLTSGIPNQITLSSPLTSDLSPTAVTFWTVAYPVYDNTNNAGSILDASGIGLVASNVVLPASGQVGSFSHYYNTSVVQIDNLVQQSKVIGTNVLVHQAQFLNFVVNLSIVYQQSVNIDIVNTSLKNAIATLFQSVNYLDTISLSSIVFAALRTPGISSARISTNADNATNFGVQEVALDGSILNSYTNDIPLFNNQLPSFYGLNTISFGKNNF